MAIYFGNKRFGEIRIGTLNASGDSIVLATPTVSINPSTGVVTATVTQSTSGYLTASSKSATLNLQTQGGATITPSASEQIAVSAGKYTIGTIKVAPIGTETKTITSNGTYSPTSGKFFSSVIVNVPDSGVLINNQNKTVNPIESQQQVTFDDGYTGLGIVTVNAISPSYVGSGISRKSSANLSADGAIVTAPAGYYAADASFSVGTGSVSAPTATKSAVSNHSLTVTPKVTTTTGYIVGQTNQSGTAVTISANELVSGTLEITENGLVDITNYANVNINVPIGSTINNQNKTVTPNTSIQTITADNEYTGLGTVTVNAIPSSYIIPSGSLTVTENNTYNVTNLAQLIVNVPIGDTINNQEKTVTPTTAQQTITFDSGYTGLSRVIVNRIPTNYIITSDANAVAANILYGKTAYVNGSKITGSMANNGSLTGTITTQNGTYTIPAGYTSGGTITANIAATTLTNSIISGSAYEEDTGDYAWKTTVNIPAGYHNAVTLTKDFSTILPTLNTPATSNQILLGYQLYDKDGKLVTGTMANNTYSNTLNDTRTSITIPAGYHDGTGTVSHTTVAIPNPTISVNSSGVITASGSWTKGYTTNNSYSNTKTLTTTNGVTATPTETEQTLVAANTYTLGAIKVAAIPSNYINISDITKTSADLTASGNTVTVPAGYYAESASKAIANGSAGTPTASKGTVTNHTITVTPSVTNIAGYITGGTKTGTSISVSASELVSGTLDITTNGTKDVSNYANVNVNITFTPTLQSKTVTPSESQQVITYDSASYDGLRQVTVNAIPSQYIIPSSTKGVATYTPGTTAQTIAAGTYLTGTQTISGDADLISSNIKSGVNIFGVAGTYSGIDTSDATATAADINSGKTAYINGSKVTGTQAFATIHTGSSAPNSSIGANGDVYLVLV